MSRGLSEEGDSKHQAQLHDEHTINVSWCLTRHPGILRNTNCETCILSCLLSTKPWTSRQGRNIKTSFSTSVWKGEMIIDDRRLVFLLDRLSISYSGQDTKTLFYFWSFVWFGLADADPLKIWLLCRKDESGHQLQANGRRCSAGLTES
jgi:hypothetical protein